MWEKLYEKTGEERGFILFPTIMLVIFVFAIGFAILELTAMETQISFNQLEAAKALSLAEAGVQMAVHHLEMDSEWAGGYRNYPFGEGIIKEVKVDNKGHSVTIESQGEVNGVGRRVRVEVTAKTVPFVNPLVTNNLVLSPGAKFYVVGDALHYGDLFLTGPGELDGLLLVDGSVNLDRVRVKGAIYATGAITVHEEADVEAMLVSSREISSPVEHPREVENYPNVPVLIPNLDTSINFGWYGQQPHSPIEEPVIFVDELWSGIFVAPEELTIMADNEDSVYWGLTAIVVPGTVRLACDLIPADPSVHSLFIVADNILVEGQVRELWAALFATESIQVMGGSSIKEIHGTLQAPSILIAPGTTRLQYCSLPGNHLIQKPRFLYQITDWLEVIHW